MKRVITVMIALVLLLCLTTVSAKADSTVYSEGFFYFTVEDGSITIVGYFGNETTVTVPSSIAGVPVNAIGPGAFANTTVQVLYLPDTILYVAEGGTGSARVIYSGGTPLPSTSSTQVTATDKPNATDTAAPAVTPKVTDAPNATETAKATTVAATATTAPAATPKTTDAPKATETAKATAAATAKTTAKATSKTTAAAQPTASANASQGGEAGNDGPKDEETTIDIEELLPQATETPEPTLEPTATPAPTATAEPERGLTKGTSVPTATPTPEPTATPEPTPTPEPTATPAPTATPEPTEAPATQTPAPTESAPAADREASGSKGNAPWIIAAVLICGVAAYLVSRKRKK